MLIENTFNFFILCLNYNVGRSKNELKIRFNYLILPSYFFLYFIFGKHRLRKKILWGSVEYNTGKLPLLQRQHIIILKTPSLMITKLPIRTMLSLLFYCAIFLECERPSPLSIMVHDCYVIITFSSFTYLPLHTQQLHSAPTYLSTSWYTR